MVFIIPAVLAHSQPQQPEGIYNKRFLLQWIPEQVGIFKVDFSYKYPWIFINCSCGRLMFIHLHLGTGSIICLSCPSVQPSVHPSDQQAIVLLTNWPNKCLSVYLEIQFMFLKGVNVYGGVEALSSVLLKDIGRTSVILWLNVPVYLDDIKPIEAEWSLYASAN